jgi:hypothetical protein
MCGPLRTDSGNAEAEFTGHQSSAIVQIEVNLDEDCLHGSTQCQVGPGLVELKRGLCPVVLQDAEIAVEGIAIRAEYRANIQVGIAQPRRHPGHVGFKDGPDAIAEQNALSARTRDQRSAM